MMISSTSSNDKFAYLALQPRNLPQLRPQSKHEENQGNEEHSPAVRSITNIPAI